MESCETEDKSSTRLGAHRTLRLPSQAMSSGAVRLPTEILDITLSNFSAEGSTSAAAILQLETLRTASLVSRQWRIPAQRVILHSIYIKTAKNVYEVICALSSPSLDSDNWKARAIRSVTISNIPFNSHMYINELLRALPNLYELRLGSKVSYWWLSASRIRELGQAAYRLKVLRSVRDAEGKGLDSEVFYRYTHAFLGLLSLDADGVVFEPAFLGYRGPPSVFSHPF